MEDWELDFHWLEVRHTVRNRFGRKKLPDLNAVLMLIGIQELGALRTSFTKEEKQDLMHIAVCRLLSFDGYYEFKGLDQDGWPHWKKTKHVPIKGVKEQEKMLKMKVIEYFHHLKSEEE